jgi:hypothetical protein
MTLQELEQTISHLQPDQLVRFREWFFEFDGACWDEKIEKDVAQGRLGELADVAIAENATGRTKPL